MKREKKKAVFGLIIMVLMTISISIPVFATDKVDTTVYDSASTTETLSWKAFNILLGYNDMGTEITGSPATGIYEFSAGGTADGELKYAWTFDGSTFTEPYTKETKGPINLTVQTASETENALGITFDLYNSHTDGKDNSLSGYANLKLKVSEFFSDGTKLVVTGSDDYSKEVSVVDGYISFDVNKGGTYVAKGNPDAVSENTTDNEIAAAESPNPVNIGLVILIIVLVLVVSGGIIVFLKRKGKHDN
ncbi:hypothetical protein [Acetobacterium bakii]|uniref:Uncharacterized protein n=1 Tax=Acetobacterium bakii TaxID=52689 RepID=A0A0L6TXH2_9FIRM|nr:hypothetical protein [Acetobacterium bakii]KNZ40777.1 hypothetical protein AKG39_15860 [Acetobacterium bakii]